MTKGQWTMGMLVVAAGFVVGMCGRNDTPVPTMTRPAGITGPTTTEQPDEATATRLAELSRIPEPGISTIQKMPDGQDWAVFGNGVGVQIIKPGNGATGRPGMRATVAYTATTADTGEVVEQYTRDNPLIFNVSSKNVMKGLSYVLMRLSMGGHERVWIPANWAYGEEGLLPKIKPNQALILDLQFIRVAGAPVEFPATKPAEDVLDLHFLDAPIGPTTAKAGEKN